MWPAWISSSAATTGLLRVTTLGLWPRFNSLARTQATNIISKRLPILATQRSVSTSTVSLFIFALKSYYTICKHQRQALNQPLGILKHTSVTVIPVRCSPGDSDSLNDSHLICFRIPSIAAEYVRVNTLTRSLTKSVIATRSCFLSARFRTV